MSTLPLHAYVLAASSLLACSTFSAAPQDSLADAGDATRADGTPDGTRPPDCDVTKSPNESPACIADTVGVFVSPAGDDAATGTKDRPVKTLSKAVALASGSGRPRVYVCEGTYDTNLVLTNLASPLAIHGGLTCAWAPADVKPTLVPPTGIALRITNVTPALLLQDLAITGTADPKVPGDSAVAVFVSASPNVTFRNVALRAGTGTHGKDQTEKGAPGALMTSNPTARTLDGNAGDATKGGPAQLCTCAGGATTEGGRGGDPNLNPDGSPGKPPYAVQEPVGANGFGQTAAQCAVSGSGTRGSDAPASPGAPGAAQSGTLTPSGWTPEPGKDALDGPPGQGGGGGGGAAGGGGGGACGGCGGEGGKGGGGGGASVALLTFESPVALLNVSLTSANAGAGGAGAQGGDGIPGGTKGARDLAACDGGNGGKGGNGGAGGGGAGGVSAGVIAKGAPPTLDATSTVTTGAKGMPGPGGTASNNGVDGQKADTLVLP